MTRLRDEEGQIVKLAWTGLQKFIGVLVTTVSAGMCAGIWAFIMLVIENRRELNERAVWMKNSNEIHSKLAAITDQNHEDIEGLKRITRDLICDRRRERGEDCEIEPMP